MAASGKITALAILFLLAAVVGRAEEGFTEPGRFRYSGDGQLRMAGEKSGASFNGRYRQPSGIYDEGAYRSICRVFGAPYDKHHLTLSVRLIEFIDYLQDRFASNALITITSGYRSPSYNTHLRNKGRLAAKASLHQYGMAADLKMAGVEPQRIWNYVRKTGFGGVGYYHGETVHLDVGPARSWDEKSSGVGTGISDDNKLIGLVTEFDLYRPGQTVLLRFIRMTAFPIGVAPEFSLIPESPKNSERVAAVFTPLFRISLNNRCLGFENMDQMAVIGWQLPPGVPAGRYSIRAGFCGNTWNAMPSEVFTPAFEIVRP